jgi:hypothetical protein
MIEYLVFIGIVLVSFAISAYSLSDIFLPLFYTIPRIIKERRNNNLKKKIPPFLIIWSPLSWTILFAFGLYFAIEYFPNHKTEFFIGIGLSTLGLLNRIGKKNEDMKDDFKRTYKEYLKE